MDSHKEILKIVKDFAPARHVREGSHRETLKIVKKQLSAPVYSAPIWPFRLELEPQTIPGTFVLAKIHKISRRKNWHRSQSLRRPWNTIFSRNVIFFQTNLARSPTWNSSPRPSQELLFWPKIIKFHGEKMAQVSKPETAKEYNFFEELGGAGGSTPRTGTFL